MGVIVLITVFRAVNSMRNKVNCSITVGALLNRNGITINESMKLARILFNSVVQCLEETL